MKELVIGRAYGLQQVIPEAQWAEWLDDLPALVDEIMQQPLTVGHPLAFCAPEMVRIKANKLAVLEQ